MTLFFHMGRLSPRKGLSFRRRQVSPQSPQQTDSEPLM